MADMHEQAELDYKNYMKYEDIAKKYNVSINTVKKWKTRYKWTREKRNSVHKKKCTPKKSMADLPIKVEHITKDGLTEKQRLFCLYYLKNFNATQAAIKAGYSKDTAGVIGYENLTKPYIRAEVERLKRIKQKSIMLTEDDIVERYMRIAFADITDFATFGTELIPAVDEAGNMLVGQDGNIKYYKRSYLDFKDHDQVDGGLICEISLGRQGMKVKLEDRQKALDWLSNYFNMNPMNQHKKQYDNAVLALREKELEKDNW